MKIELLMIEGLMGECCGKSMGEISKGVGVKEMSDMCCCQESWRGYALETRSSLITRSGMTLAMNCDNVTPFTPRPSKVI